MYGKISKRNHSKMSSTPALNLFQNIRVCQGENMNKISIFNLILPPVCHHLEGRQKTSAVRGEFLYSQHLHGCFSGSHKASVQTHCSANRPYSSNKQVQQLLWNPVSEWHIPSTCSSEWNTLWKSTDLLRTRPSQITNWLMCCSPHFCFYTPCCVVPERTYLGNTPPCQYNRKLETYNWIGTKVQFSVDGIFHIYLLEYRHSLVDSTSSFVS